MILHLETATKVCSVAISDKGNLLTLIEENSAEYSHSENLNLFIEKALKNTNLSLKKIDAISVSAGPGSYTGLRIGVSTAKGLCYALDKPLISVGALISIAAQIKDKYPKNKFCPMIDARRMEVFSSIYDQDMTIIKPISADIIEENSYEDFGEFVAAGDGVQKLKEVWKNRNELIFDEEILSSAKGQVSIAWDKFQKNEFEDVAYFEPFYLKDFK